jgi:hypothetical protein
MRVKTLVALVLATALIAPACHRGAGQSAAPILENARLTGDFLVKLTIVKQAGLLKPINGGAAIWTFKPKCKSGACSVTWTVKLNGSKGHLKRTGVYYSGKSRTPANIRNCRGAGNKEQVTLHIRVTDATQSSGATVATKIEGTMSEKNKAPGCKVSTASWKVSGTLQH